MPVRRLTPALVALLVLVGCGAGAWDAHAYAALSLRDASNGFRDALLEAHRDSIRAAAMAVPRHPGELDSGFRERQLVALVAADRAWREEHEDLMTAQVAVAGASNAYARAAFEALQGNADGPEAVFGYGGDALRALLALADMARNHGLEELPEIPPELLTFLAGRTSGGESTDE